MKGDSGRAVAVRSKSLSVNPFSWLVRRHGATGPGSGKPETSVAAPIDRRLLDLATGETEQEGGVVAEMLGLRVRGIWIHSVSLDRWNDLYLPPIFSWAKGRTITSSWLQWAKRSSSLFEKETAIPPNGRIDKAGFEASRANEPADFMLASKE